MADAPADDAFEDRLTAVERRVDELAGRVRVSEQDAAAARVLAGAADRDVGEFRSELNDFRRATIASFNALREDFNDLSRRMEQGFARTQQGFARTEQGFARTEQGFAAIRGTLDGTAAGQQQIVDLLHTIIDDRGTGPTS